MPSCFSRLRRAPLGATLIASLVLVLGLGALTPWQIFAQAAQPARKDSPKPKKKDSPERLKSKAVKLKASVEPAEAKPGETVTYKVTASLDPGYHIYDYAKEQPDQGPSVTQFDFFDTAGLTLAGDWTSDHAPEVKPDPAFDNMPIAFFENAVTWSIPLKVPAGAPAGKRTLRCQMGFMVCDAHSCSPPGQWTLPDVVLTVAEGAANVSAVPAPAGFRSLVPTTSKPETTAPAVVRKDQPAAATAVARGDTTTRPRAISEVEQKAQQGIIPLMVASALSGLLALVMPCVWPMVPITVNFFVKQGQKTKGRTTGLAIVYCLAIIGVFTAVGVLCSFFLSASALPRLANNPWLNLTVAGLFFAFGLSLLGLFEIRLPNFLLNASARGESRGGLIGVVFMALTLTITSFTCTFPVVGGLLVMASTGQFFYPIIGLATFATVLALPFFLLALAPGLLSSMPRSGDWMNSVKVVGGLVEIGAAFKFLNAAEQPFVTPENSWFDANLVLSVWVILAAVCGFYLLGFFRTNHDQEEAKVGPGRLLTGMAFLVLALYVAPALFGRPPQSMVWDRLIVGLLPPDWPKLQASSPAMAIAATVGAATAPAAREKHATSTDPDRAQREEKRFHGVWWGFSYEEALERAKTENKPILIDFTGTLCANCRLMESRVLPKPKVAAALERFVTVQLFTPPGVPIPSLSAQQRSDLGDRNAERQIELTSDTTNPWYVVLAPDGQVLGTKGGYNEPDVFLAFLNEMLGKLKDAGKVAQAGR